MQAGSTYASTSTLQEHLVAELVNAKHLIELLGGVSEVGNLVSWYNIPKFDPVARTNRLDYGFAKTLTSKPVARELQKVAKVTREWRGSGRLEELSPLEMHCRHVDKRSATEGRENEGAPATQS